MPQFHNIVKTQHTNDTLITNESKIHTVKMLN